MKKTIKDLSNKEILLAPSILAADFSQLGNEIRTTTQAGADLIHVDVMDGHFVPNISMGPPVLAKIRETTSLIFDVHLMISNPLKYIKSFTDAGADHITFHIESDDDPSEVISEIKKYGCTAGISVKPATSVEAIKPYLDKIDLILIMTVEPGFGGQKYMADMAEKIIEARRMISGSDIHLEVDGGIDETTVEHAVKSGANMLVAGTAVFRHPEGQSYAVNALKKFKLNA